jgi:glycosyltransferase involved in cell wall biosynthesis
VGRLATEKNPATAIKALAAARAADHEAQLTILGAGPLENPLHSLVKKLGVEKSVVFAGWKDPAEFLPEAELVLATSSYEGYGMSIVEALAAGVPVLSTDVGIAREAGATIAEGDFSKALNAWLDSPISSVELKMQSYTNEGEYFSAIQEFYHSLVIKIVF